MKRLGIFACYFGASGKAEEYVFYLLEKMKPLLDSLVVVCNGRLLPESRKRLRQVADAVVCRENAGFDAGAWKFAMTEFLGWEDVQAYDELVLFNDTFFGPFYPMETVFEEMSESPADFWGLTCHYEAENLYGNTPYGYVPAHINTYFLVIRQSLLKSYEFKEYWNRLPVFDTFADVVGKHEAVFTHYFEEQGFCWDVFVDAEDRESMIAKIITTCM